MTHEENIDEIISVSSDPRAMIATSAAEAATTLMSASAVGVGVIDVQMWGEYFNAIADIIEEYVGRETPHP